MPLPGTVEHSVLLTVLYADIFEHALKVEEIWRFLVLHQASREEVEAAVDGLCDGHLERSGPHVTWRGRLDHLVERRLRREERSQALWQHAERYARWMRRVPFVRMVAVCGSLAVENPRPESDVDIFLITEPNRLWLAQVAAMTWKRRAALSGMDVCPNYILSADALEVRGRNLFLARETAQAVPLWGQAAYDDFLRANPWVDEFLPNRDDARRALLGCEEAPAGTRRLERWLSGRWVDRLDRLVHFLLLRYYSLRLRGRGLDRRRLAGSYRRDRQEVAAGGYSNAVEQAFRDRVREHLGEDDETAAAVERLFPHPSRPVQPDPSFGRLLNARYGEAG